MSKDKDISYLRQRVEACYGAELTTSRHFEELRLNISARTGVLLSATTLKRIWGYLSEPVEPRLFTLDVLSRYAGWKSWAEFCSGSKPEEVESGPLGSRHIDVKRDLRRSDTVILTWAPGRVCRIRCLGDDHFEVVEAGGTRLKAGDTFRVAYIIEDAPLYLDRLTREGKDLGTYVCGSKTGVRFTMETSD